VAAIEIKRVPFGPRDSLRSYTILLDDREMARLKRGDTARFEIPPGKHVLQAVIGSKRSASFDVSGDSEETLRFTCGPRGGSSDVRAGGLGAILDAFKRQPDTWLFLERD
jgi:hypothetical protein